MKKVTILISLFFVCALSLLAQFKTASDIGQVINARVVLPTHDPTGGFVFSSDSSTLWLAAGRKAMQYEVASGKLLKTIDFHSSENPDWHMAPITAMVCNHDRSLIVSGDRDGNIKFWDPATGKVLGTILTVSQGAPINSMQFNPAGDTVADSNRSSQIYLWDVKTRRKKATLSTGDNSTFQYVRYTPNGLSLITMDNTGRIRFYSATSGVLQKTYNVAGQTQTSHNNIYISPNGLTLATGGDKEAHVYDAATGRIRFALPHEGWVVNVAFSPDSKWIATASHDKTIKLWNAATGKIVATFEGHIGEVNTVAFSLDGKTLVSGTAGEGRLWDVP